MANETLRPPRERFELRSDGRKIETPVLNYLRGHIRNMGPLTLESLDRITLDIVAFASYPYSTGEGLIVKPTISPLPRFDGQRDALIKHMEYFNEFFRTLEENPGAWLMTTYGMVRVPNNLGLSPIIESDPERQRHALYFEKTPILSVAV